MLTNTVYATIIAAVLNPIDFFTISLGFKEICCLAMKSPSMGTHKT